jgi:peptidoglycan hydrolase-like protein with peptidoglycan-binding domain
MTTERRSPNHAYASALSVAATLLALAVAPLGARAASQPGSRTSAAAMVSALAARSAVLHPGTGSRSQATAAVRALQTLLLRAAYLPGPIDGRYGPLTELAVRRYQASHGLPSTGIAGPRTLAGLSARAVAVGPGAGYPNGSRLVARLQRSLAAAGSSPGPIDGLYGPLTRRAVGRYQATHGLPVTGVADRRTLARLAARAGAGLRLGAGYGAPGSPAVRRVQRLLARAGSAPGPIDGRFGPRTEIAVRRYQAANGLTVNGIADARTLAKLDSSSGPRRVRRTPAAAAVSRSRGAAPSAGASVATPSRGRSPRPQPAKARPVRGHSTSISIVSVALLGLLVAGLCGGGLWYVLRRPGGMPVAWRRDHPPGPGRPPEPRGAGAESQPVAEPQPGGANGARSSPSAVAGIVGTHNGNGTSEAADGVHASTDAERLFELGLLLEERGDLAGAEAAYLRADQRGHPAAASNLGVLLEERGDRTGAEAAYRRAAERGGANGTFNLGVLLEERDDLTGAEAAYRHATACGDPTVARMANDALRDLVSDLAATGATRSGEE